MAESSEKSGAGRRRKRAPGAPADVEARSEARSDLPRSAVLASPTDELNQAIVRLLQDDGRLPFKDIADALDVSEGTVRNRVNWMKASGMLRIVAIADPTSINYTADAMIGIKVAPGSTPKRLAERLVPHPEVVYIIWVSGRYDLLVEIVADSRDQFMTFLERHCYDQSDIASVEVMTGLTMYKNQFLLKRALA
ncbi:MAG: AsnC family transcriptional regulator [Rhodospirillaceae bacterium]|nr:AsnC family transcriptional regulator [Rhodospirillaceae bacterium]